MDEILAKSQLLDFKDGRLDKRFETMLNTMFKNPTSSTPETFRDPYQAKAAYMPSIDEIIRNFVVFDIYLSGNMQSG